MINSFSISEYYVFSPETDVLLNDGDNYTINNAQHYSKITKFVLIRYHEKRYIPFTKCFNEDRKKVKFQND